MVLRNFQPSDQSVLLDLVNDVYDSVETLAEECVKQMFCWKNRISDRYEH